MPETVLNNLHAFFHLIPIPPQETALLAQFRDEHTQATEVKKLRSARVRSTGFSKKQMLRPS